MIAMILALSAGCGQAPPASPPAPEAEPETPAPAAHDHHDHAHHQDMPAGAAPAGQSLHQLSSTWTDQRGAALTLADLGGTPVVLAMVYTHCEYACPRIVADLRAVQDALGERADRVRFVLVSIDPERDSVERMATFARETGIEDDGWRVLRGSEGDVRELAAALGVQYRRVSATDFAHSNLIHVLDPNGVVVHRQEGLGTAPTATVAAVETLLTTR